MQQSNKYIIGFSLALTIVLGSLLTIAAVGLKPQQERAKKLDTRKNVLKTVMTLTVDGDRAFKLYEEKISGIVLDSKGNIVKTDKDGQPVDAEKINVEKNYNIVKTISEKSLATEKTDLRLPVFLYDENGDKTPEAYIFPVFGNGLWDKIWGWVALKPDMSSVVGIVMGHKGETPGLGARITDAEIQSRYKGKTIFNNNDIVGVQMLKGEGNDANKISDYQVDGMSGATLTANGVNTMLEKYLNLYKSFISKHKK